MFLKKKNCQGQALVEFVIILPIFIFMIFSIIDIGRILYYKNNLESKMDDCITNYGSKNMEKETEEMKKSDIVLAFKENEDYITFKLERKLDIITPGLNLVFGNPYKVSVKRVIYNES